MYRLQVLDILIYIHMPKISGNQKSSGVDACICLLIYVEVVSSRNETAMYLTIGDYYPCSRTTFLVRALWVLFMYVFVILYMELV